MSDSFRKRIVAVNDSNKGFDAEVWSSKQLHAESKKLGVSLNPKILSQDTAVSCSS